MGGGGGQGFANQEMAGQVECLPCSSLRRCARGLYWRSCRPDLNGDCAPCTNPIPIGAAYSARSAPLVANSCPWGCASGYEATESPALGAAGPAACRICPPGWFRRATLGSTSACMPCPIGTDAPMAGAEACTICAQGYYLEGFLVEGHARCAHTFHH